jgi:hypothetical protein
MRRLMAWIAGGVVLAGATFGMFALVETSMASAAPSLACVLAQERVQQDSTTLTFIEALGAVLSFEGPYARAQVQNLIRNAELQLQAAEANAYEACHPIITPSASFTVSTSRSMTTSTTTSTSFTLSTVSGLPTLSG